MATSKELLKDTANGAEVRISFPSGGHGHTSLEYSPRHKGDREPWVKAEGHHVYRYTAARCVAVWPEAPTAEASAGIFAAIDDAADEEMTRLSGYRTAPEPKNPSRAFPAETAPCDHCRGDYKPKKDGTLRKHACWKYDQVAKTIVYGPLDIHGGRTPMSDLEAQLAAEAAQREAERQAQAEAAAQALRDAQAAIDAGGVSIPPGAWGH